MHCVGLDWIAPLLSELRLAVVDPRVWTGFAQALLLFGLATTCGRFVGRKTGLLAPDAPESEAIGVGLALGLTILASVWATMASGGRSAFTPVAVLFAICIGAAVLRPGSIALPTPPRGDQAGRAGGSDRQHARLVSVGLSAAFIAGAAILYGSTMALMARDGVQPLEFLDEAFYSVLARDIGQTGTESVYSPSGFASLPNTAPQTWYHWGELWLASGVIQVLGSAPVDARHFVVLPVALLAAASVSGTIVQTFARTRSSRAYLFGFAACLFLAPIPLLQGAYHATWAVGLSFGITVYGSAAIAGILGVYALAVLDSRRPDWALAGVVGCILAFLLPAHILVAILTVAGLVTGLAAMSWQIVRGTSGWRVPAIWRMTGTWALLAFGVTLLWGFATGHGIGGSGTSAGVEPFDEAWQQSMLGVAVGGLMLFAAPFGWVLLRRDEPLLAAICAGATGLVLFGAVAWGARVADFNMFHVFFAGIAVFLTPIAAAVAWIIVRECLASGRRALAGSLAALYLTQMLVGFSSTLLRLDRFGPGDYDPIPVAMLDAIRALPSDAMLAYSCRPMEELAIWDPRLVSIDAHTGRRMVSMCFQADFLGTLIGAPSDPTVASPYFAFAPQHDLYRVADEDPSGDQVAAFLLAHGVEYIYVDPVHTDVLVPWAVEVARSGAFGLSRIPTQ